MKSGSVLAYHDPSMPVAKCGSAAPSRSLGPERTAGIKNGPRARLRDVCELEFQGLRLMLDELIEAARASGADVRRGAARHPQMARFDEGVRAD